MLKNDFSKIDYLILACIVNSNETEQDIVDMVQRFNLLRFQCECFSPLNIQNPCPVGDKTDRKEYL